jgi:DUF971 family protein
MSAAEVSAAQQLPVAVVNHEASAVLELRWQDGSVSRLPHPLLRTRCRCAACQQLERREGRLPEADATIRLDAIHPISDKGLNLVFSDGHGRGIFPWPYLHELGLIAKN